MSAKRILIACPTLSGINPDPALWLNTLLLIVAGVRKAGFDYAVFCPYRLGWWPANNQIWDIALSKQFDYILRLDDDVHGGNPDDFTKLYEADKDVIGAAYPARRFPYKVCALMKTTQESLVESDKKANLTLEAAQPFGYKGDEIQEVDLIGFGMTLIRVLPFKYIPRPIYKGVEECNDDSYFAQLCKEYGIKQYVHWGVRLKHQHVTLENAGHLFNADVLQEAERQAKEQANVKQLQELAPSL